MFWYSPPAHLDPLNLSTFAKREVGHAIKTEVAQKDFVFIISSLVDEACKKGEAR